MTSSAVTATVRRVSDGASIIDIAGDLTSACEGVLMDAYLQAASEPTHAIVLNFGGLDYMNSTGIGLLVTLLIRANRQGQRLLAFGLNQHYREIFELTRLDEAIGIFRSEAEALSAASGG